MTVLFALVAAWGNAFNLVAQHRASTSPSAERSPGRLALYLLSNPLWLLGAASLVGAFVFQALALHIGQLSIVQALLVTELVFALVLRRVWIRQRISAAAWAWGAATALSLGVFVVMAEPQGGHPVPTSAAWLSALLLFGLLAAGLVVLGGHGPPARRAALYATAAGIVWAVEATFIKATTDVVASFGAVGTLEHWPVYALVGGGVAGTLLVQAALHVGPLRVSQPLMVAVDPFISVILGVWLFGEHFSDSPTRVAVGAVAFAVMAVAIVFLARTAPADLAPAPAPAPALE